MKEKHAVEPRLMQNFPPDARTEHGAMQRPIRLLSSRSLTHSLSPRYKENFFVLSMYYAGMTTERKS